MSAQLTVACTTAVISGRVTADGRPILWKNRDTSQTHNELVILEDGRFRVLAVVNANSRSSVWMGVNSAGLCIENSLSKDLDKSEKKTGGMGNGQFMKYVLQNCETVEEVRKLLAETNSKGRQTRANFGVIDGEGGAAIFEAGPDSFVMFDVNDPEVAPNGYLVRSNFSTTAHNLVGDAKPSDVGEIYSATRYLQACRRLEERQEAPIEFEFVLRNLTRDLSDPNGKPYTGSVNGAPGVLPESIFTSSTISRSTTVSAAVFHGVKPNEDPALTTMWTILGDPKFSIAVPGWANMDSVADPMADKYGGELGEIAITLRGWAVDSTTARVRTKYLPGIWADLWPVEDGIADMVESQMADWRSHGFDSAKMSRLHTKAANLAMAAMANELDELKSQLLAVGSAVTVLEQTPSPSPEKQDETQSASGGETYVGVYDDAGSGKSTETLIKKLRAIDGVYVRRLSANEIRSGALAELDVLIHPGGSGGGQGKALAETGRSKVRSFVRDGGGYIGFCAGAYLASSHYSWSLNLLDAKVFDRVHWARGNGKVKIRLTEAGQSVLDTSNEVAAIYYGQGPLLVPAGDPDLEDYQVLASFETSIAKKGAPQDAMLGTTAIALGKFGNGQVFCFSPHPELTEGLEQYVTRALERVHPNSNGHRGSKSEVDRENPSDPISVANLTPDVSQKGLPNGNYCAPCAAANLLIQFDSRKLLQLPTMNGDDSEDSIELARLLGDDEHMKTLSKNGTNRFRLVNGMAKLVREDCQAKLSTEYLGIRPYDKQLLDATLRSTIAPVVGIPRLHHLRKPLDAGKAVMILFGSYRQDVEHPDRLERLGGHYVAVVGHGTNSLGQADPHMVLLHDSNDDHHGIKYVSAKQVDGAVELWDDGTKLAQSNRLIQLENAPIQKDGRIAILETVFCFRVEKIQAE